MKFIVALTIFCGIISFVRADILARKFAETIIRQNARMPDGELDSSEWRLSISGGYIICFSFDVNSDGIEEFFYSSSFNAEKLICDWSVYDSASGNPLGNANGLRPEGFWWNPSTSEMLDYVSIGAEGGYARVSHFDISGVTTRTEAASADEVSLGLEHGEPPRPGFRQFKPEAKICLLADIASNADPKWRPFALDANGDNYGLPNGRLLLSEDASRKVELNNFTPRDALLAIEKSKVARQPKPKASRESDTISNQIAQTKAKGESEPTAQRDSMPTTSVWSWITAICLVMFVAWVMFKKRP